MELNFEEVYRSVKDAGTGFFEDYAKDIFRVCLNIPLIPLSLAPSRITSYLEDKTDGFYDPNLGCLLTSGVEYWAGLLSTFAAFEIPLAIVLLELDTSWSLYLNCGLLFGCTWAITVDGYSRVQSLFYEDKSLGVVEGLYQVVKDKKWEYFLLRSEYE